MDLNLKCIDDYAAPMRSCTNAGNIYLAFMIMCVLRVVPHLNIMTSHETHKYSVVLRDDLCNEQNVGQVYHRLFNNCFNVLNAYLTVWCRFPWL